MKMTLQSYLISLINGTTLWIRFLSDLSVVQGVTKNTTGHYFIILILLYIL